jgi:RNA polymerase sigma-70 factor (ECF subfamily)
MLQETMMAAWRGLDRFQERASLRTWLYRIEPYPDALLCEQTQFGDLPDAAPGTEARYEARESISLAFVAALQHLPPRQRAALVLRDVLGFRAAETAAMLDCSLDAANNLLKRARVTIDARYGQPGRGLPPGHRDAAPLPGSARERQVTAAFVDAFERGDVAAIVRLLTDDAWLTMPPLPFGYQGPEAIGQFLEAITFRHGTRHARLVPTRANGQPAFGRYLADPHAPVWHAWGMLVLTLTGDRVSEITGFTGSGTLARFGLPRTLPD